MSYQDMISKVQEYSGLSKMESERGLKTFIKTLSSRLTPHERTDFVSELPRELQSEAASVNPNENFSMADIVQTMAGEQQVDTSLARKLVTASWQTLKDTLTPGEIDTLKAGLPQDVLSELTA